MLIESVVSLIYTVCYNVLYLGSEKTKSNAKHELSQNMYNKVLLTDYTVF